MALLGLSAKLQGDVADTAILIIDNLRRRRWHATSMFSSPSAKPARRASRRSTRYQAGRPSVAEIEATFLEYADPDDLVGQPAALSFGVPGDDPRVLTGIVEAATCVGRADERQDEPHTRYVLHVVSPLSLLGRSVDSRIYQDMTVKEIVAEILERHGVAPVEWRLTGSYPKRKYCVEYQESALDFVSRLLEFEGIYSFMEATADGEKLVFADDSPSAAPIAGDPELLAPPGQRSPRRSRCRLPRAASGARAVRQVHPARL